MPPGSESRESKRAAAAGGADHLSALPHDLIHHVLSFLPSAEAVRTCVLARSWRHLWKSVPAVRVTDVRRYGGPHALNKFVNTLLSLRDRRSRLHEVDVESYPSEEEEDYEEACRYVLSWIQYALSCQVRALRFGHPDVFDRLLLPCGLLASVSLTRLELCCVEFKDDVLGFTSCPALEELTLEFCNIHSTRIGSPSIRHLSFRHCDFYAASRARISGSNLVYLLLANSFGHAPLLESMPSLVSAFVRIDDYYDMCSNKYEVGNCGACEACCNKTVGKDTSMVLGSLSGCTSLELIADTRAFIFRKDLIRGPVFSKLKTVLLNDWCITANLGALICFLQHAPVLEKLTLQIEEIPENFVEVGAIYDVKKQHFATKHFAVEIKCDKVDDHILKIIEVLGSYGVLSEQIKILEPPKQLERFVDGDIWHYGSFSFEQEKK